MGEIRLQRGGCVDPLSLHPVCSTGREQTRRPRLSTRRSLGTWSSLAAALIGLSVTAGVRTASAQSAEEIAGARAVATEGAKAFDEGRWSDAVDLMTRAESIVHSQVQLLYLARAYDKLGKLLRARENYLKIRRMPLPENASESVRRAVANAEKELAKLEPRLPYVSVVVQGAGPLPVRVTMDGAAIPQALVGVPRPVDPGEHTFEAFAERMHSPEKKVTVKEGARETIVLPLEEGASTKAPPAAAAAAGPPPAGAETASAPPATTADTGPTPSGGGPNGLRIASYGAFGVGVVGVGVGTLFALKASSKRSDADALCNLPGGACPSDRQAQVNKLDDQANSASTLSVVGFVAGGVGLATGVTLFILSNNSSKKESSASLSVKPWLGFGSVGVTGRF